MKLRNGAITAGLTIGLSLMLFSCEGKGGGGGGGEVQTPDESTFFSTAQVESSSSSTTVSDGDLWPAAWSDDDILYTANGDGKGFDPLAEWSDIVMNKVSGTPSEDNITGVRLAAGDEIGRVWSDPAKYNRKPTGMISVDGDLYLAVQDLNKTEGADIFNDAPAAAIYKSADKGRTWTYPGSTPMFKDHVFTTVMFLDYGKDSRDNTFDDYVYAYGLDHNWRDSFSDSVPDPTELYLARAPKDKLQDAGAWEYYRGDLSGKAEWTKPGDIAGKKPVLRDERRVYKELLEPGLGSMSVLSQGSIVYNKPLDRYIYTSWTEFTFEFYEAPRPWGPWKRFLSTDYGIYPWYFDKYGGYATVIPSKYISADGREMWMNSNTFVGGVKNYYLSLRKLKVTPYRETKPENGKSRDNLALPAYGQDVTPISRALKTGKLSRINDGDAAKTAENSWNGERKMEDWWGYTWSRAYHMNQVVYTPGETDAAKGGWFESLRVQVRQNFKWTDVKNLRATPDYPADASAGKDRTYTLRFDQTWGDGLRIIGKPGGSEAYSSVAELEVYFAD
jgi:hypothetical protein